MLSLSYKFPFYSAYLQTVKHTHAYIYTAIQFTLKKTKQNIQLLLTLTKVLLLSMEIIKCRSHISTQELWKLLFVRLAALQLKSVTKECYKMFVF